MLWKIKLNTTFECYSWILLFKFSFRIDKGNFHNADKPLGKFRVHLELYSQKGSKRNLTSSSLYITHSFKSKKQLIIKNLTKTNIIKSRWLQMLSSSVKGSIKKLNDKIPLKINFTVFYHMQNRKEAPLTTATCSLKRETTSGINIFYYLC